MDEKPKEKTDTLSLDYSRRFSTKSEKSGKGDEESIQEEENIPYPKHVFFIFGNEFCERFAYYGMKTVLSLYLRTKLMFNESTATSLYHTFSSLCYFTPIFGAILSDSYLGKFKTIFYVSVVYASGSVLLSIGALDIKGDVPISLIALLVIAFGTGGIKPCVSAFGGDQFILPQQALQMVQFFAIFYFSINLGSFLSTIITPILRSDVSCFGADTCFFAAFGVPAILFIIAIGVFVIGHNRYRIIPPTGENLLVKSCKCIGNAINQKRKTKKQERNKEHWLDYAKAKFGPAFVEDLKGVLNVIVLYIPVTIYYTIYEQTGSVWVFQSTRMNGKLGEITLKPDQMQAVNAVLILLFIPLFDRVVYPVAAKCNCLTKPLHRMAWGGVLYAVAIALAGIVELSVSKTYPELPKDGNAHVSFVNGFGCQMKLSSDDLNDGKNFDVSSFSQKTFKEIDVTNLKIKLEVEMGSCEGDIIPDEPDVIETSFDIKGGESASIFFYVDPDSKKLKYKAMDNDEKEKDSEGSAKIRVFHNLPKAVRETYDEIFFECDKKRGDKTFGIEDENPGNTDYDTLEPYGYTVSLVNGDDELKSDYHPSFEMGGVYNVLVQQMDEEEDLKVDIITITTSNSYHMLLQVPQYAVLTAGEMLFSITGLQFSYDQAPASMKCVVQSCWLLANAFGNVIFILVELGLENIDSRANQSFIFAGIQLGAVAVFSFLAYRYKPYTPVSNDEEEESSKEEEQGNKEDHDKKEEVTKNKDVDQYNNWLNTDDEGIA